MTHIWSDDELQMMLQVPPPSEESEPYASFEALDNRMNDIFNGYRTDKTEKLWWVKSRKMYAIAASILLALVILVKPEEVVAKAKRLYGAIVEVFDTHTLYQWNATTEEKIESAFSKVAKIKLSYLPRGFYLMDTQQGESFFIETYFNLEREYFRIFVEKLDGSTLLVDSEDAIMNTYTIKGVDYEEYIKGEEIMIMWIEGEDLFTIQSDYDFDEVRKIAENIEIFQ